ncbi:hypothetical protein BGZ83_007555 [Gryganskiella cystojenkinii]|nr:hypothetical protein BGZ83_007555 [Gryganskiella cystojenkinii]
MDTSTRTLTASLAVVTLAALVVHTLSHPSTTSPPLDSNGRRIKGNRRANQRTRKNEEDQDTPQYIVGLVNVGNTCFVNSVLQALASLPSLRSYLEARKELGHEQDSITLTLGETVEMLNAVQGRRGTRRLDRILKSLKAKASHVLTSQQQDAQELFQIISTHLSEEREKLDHIGAPSLFDIRMTLDDIPGSISPPPVPMSSSSLISTSTSFSSRMRRSSVSSIMSTSQLLLPPSTSSRRHSANAVSGNHTKLSDSIQNINDGMKEASSNDSDDNNNGSTTANSMAESAMLDCREQEKYSRAKSPFMGLLASRVSCVDCGYTAAIRHSTFDNLSLTVPMQYACTLEDCLDAFIHLDTIHDFNCRKCTLIGASKDLERKISQGKQRQEERERRSRQSINLDKSDLPNGDHWDESAIPLLPSNSSTIEPVEENDDADKANKKSKGTIISLEEMLQLKDRIDDCLANNIEKDLRICGHGEQAQGGSIEEDNKTLNDRETAAGVVFAPEPIHVYALWSNWQEPLSGPVWHSARLYAIHDFWSFDNCPDKLYV